MAALFAAIPKILSGSPPQLLGFFGGGFTIVFICSDGRTPPDIPNGSLLTGSVDDTFYSLNIFG
jgi:hypothetical protein